MATLYPLPSSPKMFFLGTRQSSSKISQVELALMPNLSSFLATENPSKFRSTTKAVIPLYPASGSIVANTIKISASFALVIQSFAPLST